MSAAPTQLHSLAQSQSPMQQWNSDELMRSYLKKPILLQEPADQVLIQTRLRMFRVRMFELQKLRASIRPRISKDLDEELATVLYKRKILLWFTFPILELPDEIITLIFRLVVWSSATADQATLHRVHLSWVCRRFRDVALADQTLWNSVWFRDPPPWTRSLTFIERAGTAPIDVRINDIDPPARPDRSATSARPLITVDQINLILDALLPKITQLRILVVVLDNMQAIEVFMERFSRAGPPKIMERFEVHRRGAPYLWPKEKSTGVGGRLPISRYEIPNLRWLSLNGLPIDWNRFPLTNLRTIDLRRMCFQSCPTSKRWSQILAGCPDLYKLSLDAAGPQWVDQRLSSIRPVSLPHLRDLIIGDMSCLFALHIFAHMDAPNIMSLSLTMLTGQDYGPLLEMLTGRFKLVRLLSIQCMELDKTEVNVMRTVKWFESMPRLRMFKFARMQPYFLQALLADPRDYRPADEMEVQTPEGEEEERPVLCPELDALYFHSQSSREVAEIVEGRKALGKPIKRAYTLAQNQPFLTPDEITRIRANVEQFRVISNMLVTEEEDIIHEEIANSLGLDRSFGIKLADCFLA
ncbi:hypothetical protein C8Q78DRAFT_617902 [Trametes maxima]|nr:hypothetical protein C8Q78DRAFT_617902 [Trametes maxima]